MSRLSSALSEAIRTEFPSVTVGPEAGFFVHPRTEIADFSSIAAIRIAATQKIDATIVARRLLKHLEGAVPGIWCDEVGYMTVSGKDNEWWSDEVKGCEEARRSLAILNQERTVVCIVPQGILPDYAALRLIALAGTQAWLLVSQGCPCRVSFVLGKIVSVTTPEQVLAAVAEAVTEVLRVRASADTARPVSDFDPEEVAHMLPASLGGGSSSWGRAFLWINHQTLSKLSGPVRSLIEARRHSDQIVLRMPNDGWILSRERAIPEILERIALTRVVDRISSLQGWLRWLLHAASSIPSGEFDSSVGLFEEMSSPGWAIAELQKRLSRVASGSLTSTAPDVESPVGSRVIDLPRELRTTWLAAVALPTMVTRGAFSGEVLNTMRAIEQTSAYGHSYLNDPAMRLRLHMGKPTAADRKILAGLCFTVSSILTTGAES